MKPVLGDAEWDLYPAMTDGIREMFAVPTSDEFHRPTAGTPLRLSYIHVQLSEIFHPSTLIANTESYVVECIHQRHHREQREA